MWYILFFLFENFFLYREYLKDFLLMELLFFGDILLRLFGEYIFDLEGMNCFCFIMKCFEFVDFFFSFL